VLAPAAVLAVVALGIITAIDAAIVPARAVTKTDVMTVLREQ
jgi:ABC-type lipoprotein release transport system permease subunit